MRPDIGELLAASCRILEDSVAPELAQPYAREVLQGVVDTLRALQEGWPRVLPFLLWDNTGTRALLQSIGIQLGAAMTEELATLLQAPQPDPTDILAIHATNQRLREALARVLTSDDPSTRHALLDLRDPILAHLEERARRTPIRLVPQIARTTPNPEA